jgi:hypothetical protein
MLLQYHLDDVLICFGAFWIFFLAVGFTAYQANSRRPAKDPKKRFYHPFAVLLAPFIFLVLAPSAIVLLFLAVILYGSFILVFALMLVALRRPFVIIWWMRFSTFFGEPLLRIGTYLIMLPFKLLKPPGGPRQQPIPA